MPMPEANGPVPLVSVGLPTFNRASALRRAVESVLGQDWPGLELVICDNASTDGTATMCAQLAEADARVRYFRQRHNLGPAANFATALEQSRGEYFMWLGDDDWLPDPTYLSKCVSFLAANPDYSLVCGVVHYFTGEAFFAEGIRIELSQASPPDRVLGYYSAVTENGTFYGLTRRADLLRVRLKPVMAGDWLVVAAIAFLGKIKTLSDTSIHREKYPGKTHAAMAEQIGLPPSRGRFPFLFTGLSVFHEIAWGSPVYASLSPAKRVVLAFRARRVIVRRFSSLGSRERLRRLALWLLPASAQRLVRGALRRIARGRA